MWSSLHGCMRAIHSISSQLSPQKRSDNKLFFILSHNEDERKREGVRNDEKEQAESAEKTCNWSLFSSSERALPLKLWPWSMPLWPSVKGEKVLPRHQTNSLETLYTLSSHPSLIFRVYTPWIILACSGISLGRNFENYFLFSSKQHDMWSLARRRLQYNHWQCWKN